MAESSRERLGEFWDRSHAYYEQAAAANRELAPERAALLAQLDGGERLLDLGCGSCENALWVRADCSYLGLDLSTAALAMAAAAGRPGGRIRGDAGRLPFADASFDAVLSTWVLEHLHDPGAVFAEIARVLRPGGRLLLVGSSWDLPYELPPSLPRRRRLEVACRRLWRQLAAWGSGDHLFEIVRRPQVLDRGYLPDADAVFVAQSFFLERYLRALGFDIVLHDALAHRPEPGGARGLWRRAWRRLAPWRHGWGHLLLVARRGGEPPAVGYRLRYL